MAYKSDSEKGLFSRLAKRIVRPYEQTPEGQAWKRNSIASHTTHVSGRFYEDRKDQNYTQPRIENPHSDYNRLNEPDFFPRNNHSLRCNGGKTYNEDNCESTDGASICNQNEINLRRALKWHRGWLTDGAHFRTQPYELVKADLKRQINSDLANLNGGDLNWESLYEEDGSVSPALISDDEDMWALANYLFIGSRSDLSSYDQEKWLRSKNLTQKMLAGVDPLLTYLVESSNPAKRLSEVFRTTVDGIDLANIHDMAERLEVIQEESLYEPTRDSVDARDEYIRIGQELDLLMKGENGQNVEWLELAKQYAPPQLRSNDTAEEIKVPLVEKWMPANLTDQRIMDDYLKNRAKSSRIPRKTWEVLRVMN